MAAHTRGRFTYTFVVAHYAPAGNVKGTFAFNVPDRKCKSKSLHSCIYTYLKNVVGSQKGEIIKAKTERNFGYSEIQIILYLPKQVTSGLYHHSLAEKVILFIAGNLLSKKQSVVHIILLIICFPMLLFGLGFDDVTFSIGPRFIN